MTDRTSFGKHYHLPDVLRVHPPSTWPWELAAEVAKVIDAFFVAETDVPSLRLL